MITKLMQKESKLSKNAKKTFKMGFYLKFFQIYATGSGRKYLQISKFNPAHREHSIEGCNITVVLVEPKLVKFTHKEAIFTRFSGFTEPEVAGAIRKYQNSTQLIESIP